MWKGLRPNESLSRRYRTHDVVPWRGFGDSFRIEELCRGLVDAHRTKVILPHRQELCPSAKISLMAREVQSLGGFKANNF